MDHDNISIEDQPMQHMPPEPIERTMPQQFGIMDSRAASQSSPDRGEREQENLLSDLSRNEQNYIELIQNL